MTIMIAGFAGPPEAGDPPHAAEEYLTVGDPAPPLDIAHWIKGDTDPVVSFEAGHVYVLEFWASWCKYCHSAFPELAAVQREFKPYDVHVIAISDEKLSTVFNFLTTDDWNEVTAFTMATDPDLSTQRDYMSAAAIGEIPRAFIVGRDGVIEWIGHPRDVRDPLRAIVDNKWDREAFGTQFDQEMGPARERFARMAALRAAYRARDWDALLEAFDDAIAADPEPEGLKAQRFLLMIGEMGMVKEGYTYGWRLVGEFWDDAHLLNVLAWYVVDHDTVCERNLDFAMKAAGRAARLTDHTDARVLDTLARVYFERGELADALEWQRKAVAHLEPDDPLGDFIRGALARYERAWKDREHRD